MYMFFIYSNSVSFQEIKNSFSAYAFLSVDLISLFFKKTIEKIVVKSVHEKYIQFQFLVNKN